jgi:excisionase family DNA binding protein
MTITSTLETDHYVTTRVAADMLNVSLRTIQLWVESGVLRAWKTAGGHRKVSTESIEAILLKRRQALTPNNQLGDTNNQFSILLVEDDEKLRKLFAFYFTDWKHKVSLDIVSNGFDGMISLGRKIPDLLITDLNMFGINGFDLVKHLNSSPQFNKLDIAVITALSPEDFPDSTKLGSTIKLFFKPVDFVLLEAFILRLIAKKIETR